MRSNRLLPRWMMVTAMRSRRPKSSCSRLSGVVKWPVGPSVPHISKHDGDDVRPLKIHGPPRPAYTRQSPAANPQHCSAVRCRRAGPHSQQPRAQTRARSRKNSAPQVVPVLKCESSTSWRTFQVNSHSCTHKSVQPHDELSTGAAQSAAAWDRRVALVNVGQRGGLASQSATPS